jgi:hypothetical protein
VALADDDADGANATAGLEPVAALEPLAAAAPPVVVGAGVPAPGVMRNGTENAFGAVKSFVFWPTYRTQ